MQVAIVAEGDLFVPNPAELEVYRPEFVPPGSVTREATIMQKRQEYEDNWVNTLWDDPLACRVSLAKLVAFFNIPGERCVRYASVEYDESTGGIATEQLEAWLRPVKKAISNTTAKVQWYGTATKLLRKTLWSSLASQDFFSRMGEKRANYGPLFYGATDFTLRSLFEQTPNAGLNVEGAAARLLGGDISLYHAIRAELSSGRDTHPSHATYWEGVLAIAKVFARCGALPGFFPEDVERLSSTEIESYWKRFYGGKA